MQGVDLDGSEHRSGAEFSASKKGREKMTQNSAQNPASKVVFIQCGRESFVWIATVGWLGVLSQLEKMQRGCPYPLSVIAVTDRLTEVELHERFADERERGAWYRMSTALAYFIRQLQTETTTEKVYRTLSPMLQRRLPRTVVAEYFTE